MSVTSIYPVLMSSDVAHAASFYRTGFGFETTYDSDWYVSLSLGEFELAILARDHETIPEDYRNPPSGVIVNFEVDDVDAVYDRVTNQLEVEPLLAIRNEDFGQRHFIIAAPDGVLVDVIQPIPPSAEYAGAHVGQ